VETLKGIWRTPIAAKLNAAAWLYLLLYTLLLVATFHGDPAVRALRLAIYGGLFGYLTFASICCSRWPVLVAAVNLVTTGAFVLADPRRLSTGQGHAFLLFLVLVLASLAQWRRLSWRLFGIELAAPTVLPPTSIRPSLRAALARLADTPGPVLIAAGLCAAPMLAFLVLVNWSAVTGGQSLAQGLAMLSDVTIGLIGPALVVSLVRMSRWAVITTLAGTGLIAAVLVVQSPAGIVFLFFVPLPLALLLVPYWPRMTWKVFGEVLPARSETAGTFA
jgi:hypothetical protein